MKIIILAVAEQELEDAVVFYNTELPGLGYEFAFEAKDGLRRVDSFPDAWPSFTKTTRRCLLNRFPYAILYRRKDSEIIVYAFMHLKRNPEKWIQRLHDYLQKKR